MKISIINLGINNLLSVQRIINEIGHKAHLANSPNDLKNVDKLIIPGVGSYPEAIKKIEAEGWKKEILFHAHVKKIPILGICLGMQILSTLGYENEKTKGLNLIEGEVVDLKELKCKFITPHVGWNEVNIKCKNRLFENIENFTDFYFVHSFVFKNKKKENIISKTNYDIDFSSAIQNENIYGVQFHPEKSSKPGKQLLNNFIEI